MKKFFTVLLVAAALAVNAQYVTPGSGVKFNLDSLVAHSAGIVFTNGDHYEINGNITVSLGDTLEFRNPVIIKMHETSFIESAGVFIVDAPDHVVFTALDSLAVTRWRGFRFTTGHNTFINNAIIEYGGGIKVNSGGTFTIRNSTLQRNHYKSGTNSTFSSGGVLDLTGPCIVENCRIIYNQRAAIASGSNTYTPSIIRNNYIFGNTTENTNRPQINMGPTGPGNTTYIIGNTVIGNGATNSGGIAYSSLLSVQGDVVIDSNYIAYNRYGITITGSGMNGWVRYNTIIGNNIQNNPDLGGSGINFTASSASAYQHVMATGNYIEGNLWGITIVGYPVVNLGNTDPANYNPGLNVFRNNGNNGVQYDLYNNGPVEQYAMGNHWAVDSQDEASIETMITHRNDISTLGLVNFMPASQVVSFRITDMQNNPLEGATIDINGTDFQLTTSADGTVSQLMLQGMYTYDASLTGYATLTSSFTLAADTLLVAIQLSDAAYTLTFNVNDGQQPVAGALINVGDFNVTTNNSGIAVIGLTSGSYDYTVTKEGYEQASGNVIITNDAVTEFVTLTAIVPVIKHLVTFIVKVDQLPLEGSTITIADSTLVTDVEGMASIELEVGSYDYTVFSEYTGTITGTAVVNGEDLLIEALFLSSVKNTVANPFTIWPNPATDRINIRSSDNSRTISRAELTTLNGRTIKVYTNPGASINLTEIPSGYYMLKLIDGTKEHSFKVLILQ